MTAMWLGPVPSEARAVFQRARESGMSPTRALAIGHIGSFKEGWAFRRTVARGRWLRASHRGPSDPPGEGARLARHGAREKKTRFRRGVRSRCRAGGRTGGSSAGARPGKPSTTLSMRRARAGWSSTRPLKK